MSNELQIVVTMGQSLSVGTTANSAVLSPTPLYPQNVLGLNFASTNFSSNKGWQTTALVPGSFLGFTPLKETSSETESSSILNTLVADYKAAGETSPTFLNISAGAGSRSILQLMTSSKDIYSDLATGLASTATGQEFAVDLGNGTYDFYSRTATGSTFYENLGGPICFFDNLQQQITLAVQCAQSQGYTVSPQLVFNWEQGQADASGAVAADYTNLLSQLIDRVSAITTNALGPNASVVGDISQIRGASAVSLDEYNYTVNNPNFTLGATEYQYEASTPSNVGADYIHLNPQGYYMVGQDVGNKLFSLLTGNKIDPLAISRVNQVSQTEVLVHFSGVQGSLVNDPSIYSANNLLTPPSNMGFGAYNASGFAPTTFQIINATIVDASTVQLDFNGPISGAFRLYLGRTQDDLEIGGGLPGFGGSTLRSSTMATALNPTGGQTLSDTNVADYAPIQYVNLIAGPVAVVDFRALLASTAPIITLASTPPILADTGGTLHTLTAAEIASLPALGFAGIALTSPSLTLSLSQVAAISSLGWAITGPSGSTRTITDTTAAIQALSPAQITSLLATGITGVTLAGSPATLTASQAAAFADSGLTLTGPTGTSNTISDTATAIASLGLVELSKLTALHISTIAITDTSVSLSASQAGAMASAKISLSVPTGCSVIVVDSAAQIGYLSAANLSGFAALGVTSLVATDGGVTMNVANAMALETSHIHLQIPAGASALVADAPYYLSRLSLAQIQALPTAGFSGIVSTGGGVTFSTAQALAIGGLGLTVNLNGSTLGLSDTAAAIGALSVSQISVLGAFGAKNLAETGSAATLTVAQANAFETAGMTLSVPAGTSNTIYDNAAAVQSLTTAQIGKLSTLRITEIAVTDAGVSLSAAQASALITGKIALNLPVGTSVTLVDTAAHITAMTTAQFAGMAALGVTSVSASDTGLALTASSAQALEAGHISVSVPAGTTAIVSDAAYFLGQLTAAQISGLPSIGVTGLYSPTANVSFSAAQTSAIIASGLSVSAGGIYTVTENLANAGYSVYQLGSLITQKTVNADLSYDIAHFNATGAYASYDDVYSAAAVIQGEARNMNDGTGVLLLSTNALTVHSGPNSLSVAVGPDTFAFNAHASESILASGHSSEIFAYDSGFGASSITGFVATGSTHDVAQFSSSALSSATDLLAHTIQNGSNAMITDATGDTLTMVNITKTTLAANLSDFRFI